MTDTSRFIVQDSETQRYLRQSFPNLLTAVWTDNIHAATRYVSEANARILIWLARIRGKGQLSIIPEPSQENTQ